jgi:hypothetical protein
MSISYKNYEALLFSTPSYTLPPPSVECILPSKCSISDSVLQWPLPASTEFSVRYCSRNYKVDSIIRFKLLKVIERTVIWRRPNGADVLVCLSYPPFWRTFWACGAYFQSAVLCCHCAEVFDSRHHVPYVDCLLHCCWGFLRSCAKLCKFLLYSNMLRSSPASVLDVCWRLLADRYLYNDEVCFLIYLICKSINRVVRMLVYWHIPGWVHLESTYNKQYTTGTELQVEIWMFAAGVLIKFRRNWCKEEVKCVGLRPIDS